MKNLNGPNTAEQLAHDNFVARAKLSTLSAMIKDMVEALREVTTFAGANQYSEPVLQSYEKALKGDE